MTYEFKEGQTPIDESERAGLKVKVITTQQELDRLEQRNIEQALRWMIGRKIPAEEILTEQFIKALHRRMFKDVWKWAGQFRRTDKNIGVRWYEVPIATRQLCEDARFWVAHGTYPAKELAIRFKHRLVSIHCFPNGNGRHSRLMADVLITGAFGLPAFGWRGSRLVRADEQRNAYIQSLRQADQGNLVPLLTFALGEPYRPTESPP
ncbi:MAG: mobile mystery protein B [Bacteroidota bacterium]